MSLRYHLRMRLAFAYVCWSVMLTILVGFLAYHILLTRIESQLDGRMHDAGGAIVHRLTSGQVPSPQPVQSVDERPDGYAYEVLDANGFLLSGAPADLRLPMTASSEDALVKRAETWETLEISGTRLRVLNWPMTHTDGKAGLLRVAAPLEGVDEVRNAFVSILLWVVPIVAVAGALSAWLVLRQALMPVRQISMAAQQIIASDLAAALPLRGSGDELDQISEAFNRVTSEVHAASQRMWQYLSNISHELRTPLAALRAETEVALRWARSDKEYRQVLQSNMQELDRITKTVAAMLDLAKAEAGQVQLTRKPDSVTEIARTAVGAMEALAAQRGVVLQFESSDNVTAEIASEQVARLLLILLDNAIKYSYASGTVKVGVKQKGTKVLISVADKGRGIAPEDLPHIFERFYRSQKSGRVQEIEGAGLGLSHADWIVKMHGGRIEVESKPGRGTQFLISLPLEAQRQSVTA